MIILPVIPSIPHYTFETVIDDVGYEFEMRWNGRDSAWYMSIFDSDNIVIILNAKVVLGAYIGRRANNNLMYHGAFVAIDTTKQGRDAGLDDLGTRVEIRYYSDDELVDSAMKQVNA